MRRLRAVRDKKRDNGGATGRVIDAWARLTPDGLNEFKVRRDELRELATTIIERHGIDTATAAFEIVTIAQAGESDAGLEKDVRRAYLALTEDACRVRPALRRLLREAGRVHRESARHKWYAHFSLTAGADYATRYRRWRQFSEAYRLALEAVDADPLFEWLTSRPFQPATRGNPRKRRNSELRRQLQAEGLSRAEVSRILSALGR